VLVISYNTKTKEHLKKFLESAYKENVIRDYDFVEISEFQGVIICFEDFEKFMNFYTKYEEEKFINFSLGQIHWHVLPSLICHQTEQQDELLLEQIITPQNNGFHSLKEFLESELKVRLQSRFFKNLIVTDPYIFPKRHDLDYQDRLIEIFEVLKKYTSLERVLFIAPLRNIDTVLKNSIFDSLKTLEIYPEFLDSEECEDEFHDRFWIFIEKNASCPFGFVIGTSLNGTGKRITLVSLIPEKDLKDLCNFLTLDNICYKEKIQAWLEGK